MVIDSHQHFWNYDPIRFSWINDQMNVIRRDFLPDELLQHFKRHSIDGCVAVQADQTEEETLFLLELAEKFSFIKGVIGWVDLKSPLLSQRLQHFSQYKKLKGFRHIVQGEAAGFMDDPGFVNGVNELSKHGYTYDLLIYHYQLEEALRFLDKTRNVRIVIDHIAKPSIRTGEKTHWELLMAAAGSFKNVYCKISGMVTEADWKNWTHETFYPYLDEVFEIFGTERVMYGSDWPVCLVAASYQQQLEIVQKYISQFASAEKERIMGKNAETFYNL